MGRAIAATTLARGKWLRSAASVERHHRRAGVLADRGPPSDHPERGPVEARELARDAPGSDLADANRGPRLPLDRGFEVAEAPVPAAVRDHEPAVRVHAAAPAISGY